MNSESSLHERMFKKIINNEDVIMGNITLWTPFLDNYLKDFVVCYNFDFIEIAKRFQEFIALPYKYDFSEDECKRHWSFLHASRGLNIIIDDNYYERLKNSKPKIKPKEIANFMEENDKSIEGPTITKNKEPKVDINVQVEEKPFFTSVSLSEVKLEEDIKKEIEVSIPTVIEKPKREEIWPLKKLEDDRTNNSVDINTKESLSMNSSFSGDDIDQNENDQNNKDQDNIILKGLAFPTKEEPDSVVQMNIDRYKEMFETSPIETDDFIESLFKKKKNTDSNENGEDLNIFKRVEKSHEEFPIQMQTQKASNYNLDDDDDEETEITIIKKKTNIESELSRSKDMESYIKENPELLKQQNNLDNFCNFAVQSLKYFVPKLMDGVEGDKQNQLELSKALSEAEFSNGSEIRDFQNTTLEINNLLVESFNNAGNKIDRNINNGNETDEKLNKIQDQGQDNVPEKSDQAMKLAKFKDFMFADTKNLNSDELLQKITNVLNTDRYRPETSLAKNNYQLGLDKESEQMLGKLFLKKNQEGTVLNSEDLSSFIIKKKEETYTNSSKLTISEDIKPKIPSSYYYKGVLLTEKVNDVDDDDNDDDIYN